MLLPVPCLSALKWYRAKCNIQAEIEEMQEEQRSLLSVETLSVWKLLVDDTVRWQVLSVVVINIGMQLSGIDAVRKLSNVYAEEKGVGMSFLILSLEFSCKSRISSFSP